MRRVDKVCIRRKVYDGGMDKAGQAAGGSYAKRNPGAAVNRSRVFFGVCLVTSNSYNVRNVNTDGTLNNNNAYNGNNGVRPLWWITRNE